MMNTDLLQRDITNQNALSLVQKLLNSSIVMILTLLGVQDNFESQIDISIQMVLTSKHDFFENYSPENSKNIFGLKATLHH